jgi:hypothetical protein
VRGMVVENQLDCRLGWIGCVAIAQHPHRSSPVRPLAAILP